MFLPPQCSEERGLPGSRARSRGGLQLGLTRAVIAPPPPGQLGLGQPSGISLESAPRSERPHSASGRRGSWCLSVTAHRAAAAAPHGARAPVAARRHSGSCCCSAALGAGPPRALPGSAPPPPSPPRGSALPGPRWRRGGRAGGGGLLLLLLLDVHPQSWGGGSENAFFFPLQAPPPEGAPHLAFDLGGPREMWEPPSPAAETRAPLGFGVGLSCSGGGGGGYIRICLPSQQWQPDRCAWEPRPIHRDGGPGGRPRWLPVVLVIGWRDASTLYTLYTTATPSGHLLRKHHSVLTEPETLVGETQPQESLRIPFFPPLKKIFYLNSTCQHAVQHPVLMPSCTLLSARHPVTPNPLPSSPSTTLCVFPRVRSLSWFVLLSNFSPLSSSPFLMVPCTISYISRMSETIW